MWIFGGLTAHGRESLPRLQRFSSGDRHLTISTLHHPCIAAQQGDGILVTNARSNRDDIFPQRDQVRNVETPKIICSELRLFLT